MLRQSLFIDLLLLLVTAALTAPTAAVAVAVSDSLIDFGLSNKTHIDKRFRGLLISLLAGPLCCGHRRLC